MAHGKEAQDAFRDWNECPPEIFGVNAWPNGRVFIEPLQELDLTIQVKNGDLAMRYFGGFVVPIINGQPTEDIEVNQIMLRRPNDTVDSLILEGDPINLLQVIANPLAGQTLTWFDKTDLLDRNSEIVFTMLNTSPNQGYTVNITAVGYYPIKPLLPKERRPRDQMEIAPDGAGEPAGMPMPSAERGYPGDGPQRYGLSPRRGPIR